jgi:hypothetical protein
MATIAFKFETEHGTYRDAIVLPDDHGLAQEAIDAIKQQRVDTWLEIMNQQTEEE